MKNDNYQLLNKAKKLYAEHKTDEAIQMLRAIETFEPNDPIIQIELAKILLKNKQTKDEGVKVLEGLVEKHNDHAALMLGRLALKENRLDDAKEFFKKLVDGPKKTRAIYELGRVQLKKGNLKKAKEYFLYVKENEPKDLFTLFELGKIAFNDGELLKAKEYFKTILSKKYDIYALFELGKVEYALGEYDDAIKHFEEILQYNIDDYYALLELGKAEVKKGNLEKAKNTYHEILRIKKGKDVLALYELGRVEFKSGNHRIALEFFERVLKLKPNDIPAQFEIGKIYYACGNNKRAMEIYDDLIVKYDYYSAKIEKGRVLAFEGNLEEAENLFRNMMTEENKADVLLELGRLAVISQNNAEARKYFSSLQNTEAYDYATFELILLLIKEGDFFEANELFKSLPERFMASAKYNDTEAYLNYLYYKNFEPLTCTRYFDEQLYHYSKSTLLNHILRHQYCEDDRRIYNIFNDNVDINELIDFAENEIKDMNPSQSYLIDKYLIHLDKTIAFVDGCATNSVAVNVLPNSKQILSIYPILLTKKYGIKDNKKVYTLKED